MTHTYPANEQPKFVQILRHADVRQKLSVSEAKLFDMIAKGLFPKPFLLIPGGRSVGWLESDVDKWILERKQTCEEITA